MSEYRADETFAIVPVWLIESKVSDRALRLYALLSGMRDYGNDMASVGRKLLASKLGCSDDSLDRAKKELEKLGAITVVREQLPSGQIKRNVYTIHRVNPTTRTRAATPIPAPERGTDTRNGAAMYERESLFVQEEPSVPPAREQVKQAWLSADGMIQHRDSYFTDDSIRRLLDKVVKKYGVDDVVKAIMSYAAVLASPEHFFNYRWTLGDFLTRGLDKFVPEAEPERVFRGVRQGTSGVATTIDEDDGYTRDQHSR